MTLKDFYPFTKIVTEWCCEQPNMTGFSIRADDIFNSLLVDLEFGEGQRVYRVSCIFSHLMIETSYNLRDLIDIVAEKHRKTRDQIEINL